MIRNLVFDMGNVLIHYIPQVFMDRLGVPAEDQPLLAREVFGSVEWIRMDRGTLGQEEAVAACPGVCGSMPAGWCWAGGWTAPSCPWRAWRRCWRS